MIPAGTAAAAGIAWINTLGNLAGYLSPEMVAWLKSRYDMSVALDGVAVMLVVSAGTVLLVRTGVRVSAPSV
jgi:hypothetical protein